MIIKKLLIHCLLTSCFAMGCSNIHAQLEVSKLFGNDMVIQRNKPISVWGWQNNGKEVKVDFNGISKTAIPNEVGEWSVEFPQMQADTNARTLQIISGEESISIKNILIGDVWVCSGQSNMEWALQNTENADEAIAHSKDFFIRHFKIPQSYSKTPETTLAGGEWKVSEPITAGQFTAVGYYFAKNLRESHKGVPIGLLNSSWGGSRIEPWMNAQTLGIENAEDYLNEVLKKQKDDLQKRVKKVKSKFPNIKETKEEFSNDNDDWASEDLDLKDWVSISVPSLWEEVGYDGFDGIVWYRTTFEINQQEKAQGVTLHLGMIDDSDIAWVNGQFVGETIQQYDKKRIYKIPSAYLKKGINTIAVRVDDTGGGGGIYGSSESVFIETKERRISLAKDWKLKIEAYRQASIGSNQIPTLLYNKMIYPILKFPIAGVIWYQGESNADTKSDAIAYRNLFSAMIQQWRNDWKIGTFPFLFVQLANFKQAQLQPIETNWAILRASQTAALQLPNTAQAVIIDIGDANDIHPRNKKDVGYRLALAAKKLVYGNKDIIISGPTFKEYSIEDNKVKIAFNHVTLGLVCKNKYGYVNGFAIAGDDEKYYWAKGILKDNKVIIWSDKVQKPTHVRYAWEDNPDDVNLYNKEGLPAVPFQFEIKGISGNKSN